MKSTRRLARLVTMIAAVVSLSVASGLGGERPPPDAMDAPEVARELAVAAQRFIDALDP